MKAISLLLFLTVACSSYQDPKIDPKKEPIKHRLYSKMEQYRQCYHESDTFMNKKDMSFNLEFIIDSTGAVRKERITDFNVKDPNFNACILGIVKKISFTPAEDGGTIEVKQPMQFHAKVI